MIHATPTKLRSGDWGARCTSVAAIGDTIRITTRSGKSWDAQVSAVIWSDSNVSVVATHSDSGSSSSRRSRGSRTGCSCGSREDANGQLIPSSRNCWQCDHDA